MLFYQGIPYGDFTKMPPKVQTAIMTHASFGTPFADNSPLERYSFTLPLVHPMGLLQPRLNRSLGRIALAWRPYAGVIARTTALYFPYSEEKQILEYNYGCFVHVMAEMIQKYAPKFTF